MSLGLLKSLGVSSLVFLSTINPLRAQEVADSVVNLDEIPVNVSRSSFPEIPKKTINDISLNNENLAHLFTTTNFLNLNGISNQVYEDVILGTSLFRQIGGFKIPQVLRNDLNTSLISQFGGLVSQIDEDMTAEAPSSDLALVAVSEPIKDGSTGNLNSQLFQHSLDWSINSEYARSAVSFQLFEVPQRLLWENARKVVNGLGEGGRAHTRVEIGSQEERSPRINIEAYNLDLDSQIKKRFNAYQIDENDNQAYILTHFEIPFGERATLESILSRQHGFSELNIQDREDSVPEKVFQEIGLTTFGFGTRSPEGDFRFTFHELEKTDVSGYFKNYSISQFSFNRISSFLGLDSRINTRFGLVDFQNMDFSTESSLYFELEKNLGTAKINFSLARLQDFINPEVSGSLLNNFSLTPYAERQDNSQIKVEGTFYLGNHKLIASIAEKEMDLKRIDRESKVKGLSFHTGWQFAKPHYALTAALAYRPMKTYRRNEESDAPGVSIFQLKSVGLFYTDKSTLGVSFGYRTGTILPVLPDHEENFLRSEDLWDWDVFFSRDVTNSISLSAAAINLPGWIEIISERNTNGTIAVYGPPENRMEIEKPSFAHIGLNIEF